MGLGPELVTNGGFDADSDWTKGDGWEIVIAGWNRAEWENQNGTLSQELSGLVAGKKYRVSFALGAYTVASELLEVSLGGDASGETFAEGNSSVEFDMVAGSGSQLIEFAATNLAEEVSLTLDTVSVKEIIGDQMTFMDKIWAW